MLLSKESFEKLYSIFLSFIEENSGDPSLKPTLSKYQDLHENYKYKVNEEANENLNSSSWKLEDIGTGKIYNSVVSAIKTSVTYNSLDYNNNLIDWRKKDDFIKKKPTKRLEQALYNLFTSKTDESQIFEQLIKEKLSYQIIAYFFFIKDINRFLPISQQRFDTVFEFLNLDFKTSRNVSWSNYQTFCDIVKQAQEYLLKIDKKVSLLDAHSFLWTVSKAISEEKSTVTILNTQQWEKILKDQSLTKDLNIDIFRAFFSFPYYTATSQQAGVWANIEAQTMHLRIGEYAKRIAAKYPINFTVRENGKNKFWDLFFEGAEGKGNKFYWTLRTALRKALENLQLDEEHLFPNEIIDKNESYREGAQKTITVNVYERNRDAREDCIKHFGTKCIVCSFDFEKAYGDIGAGFIHVHHIIPVSIKKGNTYKVNPLKDLVPICPNCHAMIHRGKEALSIEKLKQMLKQ